MLNTEPQPQMTNDYDDTQLIRACRNGDAGAWEQLIRRYRRLIYTIPRRAGLDDDQAADVFQVVFSKLFENLDKIAQPDRLQAWLVTTAKRESIRLANQGRRMVSLAGDDESEADPMDNIADNNPLPDEIMERLQFQQRIWVGMDSIDERCRNLLQWLYSDDEAPPYAEIAARLGISEGSIGPTRARCLEKLRKSVDV
jgi:RNA polymerase sigma factor (sigma-70 family)